MSDSCFFIDTNIFVYSFDNRAPDKRDIARELIGHAIQNGNGRISYQVIQEFLNVSTRKFEVPLTTSDAQIYLKTVLEPLCEIYASAALFYQALETANRWKYSFYDSLIIAAAISADCDILYSEDLQHTHHIGKLTIVNPFL
jgi:predicted nucleic acid-binding protein